ncbi:hypothetical protein CYV26_03520 [Carnobacterium maltaromaticum]|nr:hypothetical protein CYV33_00985 [Carnobacterium maltaromaticum]PLS40269.1 hypothetical protein CYV30_00980 [Carnobacterium maltaromaticum]PLS40607.1 hypothetical protein CYV31_00980 [Carnobacterium maltaromaticum]PLS46250.1 hypothetical protein CYV28_00980 [Carnobacterium maltaromaticum]PLS47399.1 hypothetical protein CYV27_02990 [Carnobacterium maltaromaticum]
MRPALFCQLLEKKIKIREDKERPSNFSYFLAGAERQNELFIFIQEVTLNHDDSFKIKEHYFPIY